MLCHDVSVSESFFARLDGRMVAVNATQIEFPLAVAVCAWCKPNELGEALGAISHGICPRHLRKMKIQLLRMAKPRPGKRSSAPRPVTMASSLL
jgi:hypothetical protein